MTSFVYTGTRDSLFDPALLLAALRRHGLNVDGIQVDGLEEGGDGTSAAAAPPLAPGGAGVGAATPSTTTAAADGGAFAGVVRSKGFVRLSHAPGAHFYWSHAGRNLELRRVDADARGADASAPQAAQAELGRGHDLVIIGVNMDAAAATRVLDACLV